MDCLSIVKSPENRVIYKSNFDFFIGMKTALITLIVASDNKKLSGTKGFHYASKEKFNLNGLPCE